MSEDHRAERNAPSKPYLTDEWVPTDPRLWTKVLMVAKGRRREMTRVGPDGPRTIHAPNNGRGFRHWPNQRAVAWAVKQYNGYGGRWKGKDEATVMASQNLVTLQERLAQRLLGRFQGISEGLNPFQVQALEAMRTGSVLTTPDDSHEHLWMLALEDQGLARLVEANISREESYWDITRKGARKVVAGLGASLTQKMEALLAQPYDLNEAKNVGAWLKANFRFDSPKTPKGQKDLKEELSKLGWYLAHGTEAYQESVKLTWGQIKPRILDAVKYFTDEGGKVVPQEIQLGGNTYLNQAGLDEATLSRYANRLEVLWSTIHGWRKKALLGGLKVSFASPRDFKGTASGKYKSSGDILMVRTTPAILKRDAGYAGFDYILVHELGHRYHLKGGRLPEDFDQPHWWTSKYSRQEGEAFAELFAIGNYRLTGSWDPAVLERFEKVMT